MGKKNSHKKNTTSRSAHNNSFFNQKKPGRSFFDQNNVQRKASDSQSDPYEKEADKAADQVTGRLYHSPFFPEAENPNPVAITPLFGRNTSFFQSKPAFESPTEMEANTAGSAIQQKKDADIPSDRQEQHSVNTDMPPIQREEEEGVGKEMPAEIPSVKNIQAKGQRNNPAGDFKQRMSSSTGQPLPRHTQQQMEQGFGADFSKVRTHTDPDAVQMSRDIGAQAFTHGHDIYFNEGKFKPGTREGDHLIAHELTHTQQQKGVQRKAIQRAEDPTPDTEASSTKLEAFEGESGQVDLRGSPKRVQINKVRIPDIKYLFTKDFLNKPIKKGSRPTDQRQIWIKEANKHKPHIENKIREKANKEENKTGQTENSNTENRGPEVFYFKIGRSSRYLIGTVTDIKNALLVPSWNERGAELSYDVDHKLEYQFGGEHDITNFWLLESKANRDSGRKIDSQLIYRLGKVLKEAKGTLWQEVPNTREVLKNFEVLIKQFNKGLDIDGRDYEHYNFDDITQEVKPLDALEPLSEKKVADKNLRGSATGLKLFTSTKAGRFVNVPWEAGSKSKSGLEINYGKNFIINEVTYDPPASPNKEQEVGKIRGTAFKGNKFLEPASLTFKIKKTPAIDFGGFVKETGILYVVRKIFKLKGFSDIEVADAQLDPKLGLVFDGLVISDLPFINKGTSIGISVKGNDVSLKKTFETGDINLPPPFEMTDSRLTVEIGRRLRVTGRAGFEIKGVGEGSIKGIVSSGGDYGLKGTFEFDKKLFRGPASIKISYVNGEWGISGKLKFRRNKVHGIKSGEISVDYQKEKLAVFGKAQPTIPGISEIELEGVYAENLFFIGLDLQMSSDIPLLKKGALSGEISKKDGQKHYDIMAAGRATLDIPGIQGNPEIVVSYDKGAMLIHGKVPFKLGKAKGSIMVGITNQGVDENGQPTGEIAESWSAYGKGDASLELSRGIIATAKVELCQNGDIIISGEVGLGTPGEMKGNEGIDFKHDLFRIAPPPIILFGIPGANLSVQIIGGARLYALLTPPRVEELMLGLEGFNLTAPDANTEIIGRIRVGVYGKAGLELYLTLKAMLTVLVAKVSGELTGSVGLEANAGGQAVFEVSWSPAQGLAITEGAINLQAGVQFLAKLSGKVRVYLDLWLAEVDIWEEYLDIASVSFGPTIQMGVRLPAKMEDGQLKSGEVNKNSFEYPNVESDSKQQELTEQAVKQDEKLKPPPPPSMEEALQAIRRLGPGRGYFLGKFDKGTLGHELSEVIKDLNRESYYLWLINNYPDINWGVVRTEMNRLDQLDFERLKARLSTKDYSQYKGIISPEKLKIIEIEEFEKSHERFPRNKIVDLKSKVYNKEI